MLSKAQTACRGGRIGAAFSRGKAFIGFVTGGDPTIQKTGEFIRAMENAGTDIIEIGIPFSDPIAEGPVIQAANVRALAAGATVEKIFALVEDLRREGAALPPVRVPLVFLTYLNPVFKYTDSAGGVGFLAFFKRCKAAGVDGVIIPDLPFEENAEVKAAAREHGVALISLIAPTSHERIAQIAAAADGFLYIVSSMGVTGVRGAFETDIPALVAAARRSAAVPLAVGFGISTPAQAADIARHADGVIVGSAIVNIVAEHGLAAAPHIAKYAGAMKAAIAAQEGA